MEDLGVEGAYLFTVPQFVIFATEKCVLNPPKAKLWPKPIFSSFALKGRSHKWWGVRYLQQGQTGKQIQGALVYKTISYVNLFSTE